MRLPRHAEIWLPSYVADRARALFRAAPEEQVEVWLAITDHYEPFWHSQDENLARERVDRWVERWPSIAEAHPDSEGRPAQYSFFYPEEEYREDLLERLSRLCHAGWGEVEIHIHHDCDGEEAFLERMAVFRDRLADRHELLRKVAGRTLFGFIHGNWALDNSRPDGRWCGLNNELQLLRRLGCYADFTMPSGASPTQARALNRIYWATDDPARPKSYDRGREARAGEGGPHGDLLMVPGPLGLRWRGRAMPRMETGELASNDPPDLYRVKRWLELAPRLANRIFVKLHTHGTQEKNSSLLLEGGLERLFSWVSEECRARGWRWRWATAWQMYRAIANTLAGREPELEGEAPWV